MEFIELNCVEFVEDVVNEYRSLLDINEITAISEVNDEASQKCQIYSNNNIKCIISLRSQKEPLFITNDFYTVKNKIYNIE